MIEMCGSEEHVSRDDLDRLRREIWRRLGALPVDPAHAWINELTGQE